MDRKSYFMVYVGHREQFNAKGESLGFAPVFIRKETRHQANELWRRMGKRKSGRPEKVKF